jgi:cell wall-associated NlpC family hydrolase
VTSMLGLVGASAPVLVGSFALPAGADTSTTTPGPAPNQAQINAAQSQVSTIEASLAQEEQQSSILDDRYNTAVQNLQTAQSALQSINASLVQTKASVAVDKHRLANDAVKAYIYATPVTNFTSLFTSPSNLGSARDQYTNQAVGNLNNARDALQISEAHLAVQQAQQQRVAADAHSQADQAKSLAAANQQEAAATQATLSQVKGQLAQEVAQAAVLEAQQQAQAAAAAASAAAQQKATAAAQAAAAVAQAVGGTSSGNAATTAANQASASAPSPVGPVGASGGSTSQGQAAVNAAESQLGVPYVFGGESPGSGFDCSGLTQWAWATAGVSIPRTTESQWPALTHVSMNALEPGDLLYYYNLDGDDQVDHVVMYVGNNTVIAAPFTGSTVSYSPIFYGGLIGAARP